MSRRTVIALTAALGALAVPTAAPAAETLGQLGGPVMCAPTGATPVAMVQGAVAPTGTSYSAPASGVLTKFTMAGMSVSDAPPAGAFRVFRGMTPVASVPFTLTAGGASRDARVPVVSGDTLGVSLSNGYCAFLGSPGDSVSVGFDVPDGTAFVSALPLGGGRLPITAVFERDADGDGFGDDSQDGCTTDATRQGSCSADLSTSLSLVEASIPVGGVGIVTARVTNSTEGVANGVRLVQSLPEGVQLIAATPSQGSCAGLDCSLGDLPSGGSAIVVAGVRATSAGAKALSATASSTTSERNAADNAAGATLTAVAPPAVAAQAPAPVVLPRTCRVPKLTGLSRSAAKLVLEAATCRLGSATRQKQKKGTTRGAASVRRQSRKAGTEWPAGTRVNVVLAKKKAKAKRRG